MIRGNQGTANHPVILQELTKDGWKTVMKGTGSEVFRKFFGGKKKFNTLSHAIKANKGKYRVIDASTGVSIYPKGIAISSASEDAVADAGGDTVNEDLTGVEDIVAAQETSLSIERDLQTFLCSDLGQIEKGLKLYKNGKEFTTEVGRIDILAIDDHNDLVVIELKAGPAKHSALGQLVGYMGYISDKIANGRNVRGYIIASDFDDRLKYAVKVLPNIYLKAYKVNFTFENIR